MTDQYEELENPLAGRVDWSKVGLRSPQAGRCGVILWGDVKGWWYCGNSALAAHGDRCRIHCPLHKGVKPHPR